MAAANRSAGRSVGTGRRFHPFSTTSTPMKETALRAKAQVAPSQPTTSPPRAGPMARLTLKPALLSATPAAIWFFGTRSGTEACQAGAFRAAPTPSSRDMAMRRPGVTRCRAERMAMARATSSIQAWVSRSSRRRSTMSAMAPPGMDKISMGRVAPVSMRLMSSGDRESSDMSHFSPTLWTQVPTFEAMAAIQIARKRRLRNGAKGDLASVTGSGYPECSTKKLHHQDTKAPRKAKRNSFVILGVLVSWWRSLIASIPRMP